MVLLGSLALLSLALTAWQWLAGWRFPLHLRVGDESFAPAVTLLKPLKGCDTETAACLRSWLAQDYAGPVQILFGVASADDPVCAVVRQLLAEFPARDARLVICEESLGANAKVSKLIQLARQAKHEVVVISDADVRVPADLLTNAVAPLRDRQIGLVNCLYRLANPTTLAMRWEAIAVNADFWSQVLQSRSLRPLDFALGAVMATRRRQLEEIGGFEAIVDCLADDYQLGNRIAGRGYRIELCPVVVECRDAPRDWREVWRHQLRWARTIRVCQPLPYFFSILSNATLWPLLWCLWAAALSPLGRAGGLLQTENPFVLRSLLPLLLLVSAGLVTARILAALHLERRLTRSWRHLCYGWLVPLKDLLQVAVWVGAFTGRQVEWRGEQYQLRGDGTLVRS